jgi:sulfite reductase alpha subunit-like flavoprotein
VRAWCRYETHYLHTRGRIVIYLFDYLLLAKFGCNCQQVPGDPLDLPDLTVGGLPMSNGFLITYRILVGLGAGIAPARAVVPAATS